MKTGFIEKATKIAREWRNKPEAKFNEKAWQAYRTRDLAKALATVNADTCCVFTEEDVKAADAAVQKIIDEWGTEQGGHYFFDKSDISAAEDVFGDDWEENYGIDYDAFDEDECVICGKTAYGHETIPDDFSYNCGNLGRFLNEFLPEPNRSRVMATFDAAEFARKDAVLKAEKAIEEAEERARMRKINEQTAREQKDRDAAKIAHDAVFGSKEEKYREGRARARENERRQKREKPLEQGGADEDYYRAATLVIIIVLLFPYVILLLFINWDATDHGAAEFIDRIKNER